MAVLLTAGALADPALARQGPGLYAPFPSPPAGARAQRFVGELGVTVKPADLRRGHSLAAAFRAQGAARAAATARTGLRGAHAGAATIVLPALLLVAGAALAAAVGRSR
jgi:hypothetical protein